MINEIFNIHIVLEIRLNKMSLFSNINVFMK